MAERAYIPAMMTRLDAFLANNGISQGDVAGALGVTDSAVSRKLNGLRPIRLNEVQRLLAFLSERVGRAVEFEEVFAPEDEHVTEETTDAR